MQLVLFLRHSDHTNNCLRALEAVHVQVCDKMSFIRVNESLVDDLSYERGIVPSRVALCDDLLRFSLSSNDLSRGTFSFLDYPSNGCHVEEMAMSDTMSERH